MIDEILLSASGGCARIALREEGRLMELLVEAPAMPGAVGDILLGRVTAILKGMEACFIDIGLERAGFLSLVRREGMDEEEGPALSSSATGVEPPVGPVEQIPTEGAAVLVQVTKVAQMGKGAGLTRNITLPGLYLVFTPFRPRVLVSRRIADAGTRAMLEEMIAAIAEPGEGFIARTAAAGAGREALAEDAAELRHRWQEITRQLGVAPPALLHGEGAAFVRILRDHAHEAIRRVVVDKARAAGEARAFFDAYLPDAPVRIEEWPGPGPLFEAFGLEEEIAAALDPEVRLPCGGTVMIEETHALTAIDVNTGRNVGVAGHAATVFATNLEAAEEISRQLRLRNVGGLIVIDFVHMDDPEHRSRVRDVLLHGLAQDRAFIRATDFSELGLIELIRRRGRGPLRDQLALLGPSLSPG